MQTGARRKLLQGPAALKPLTFGKGSLPIISARDIISARYIKIGILIPTKHGDNGFRNFGGALFINAAYVDLEVVIAAKTSLVGAELEFYMASLVFGSVICKVL